MFLLALFVMTVQAQADTDNDQVDNTDNTQQGTGRNAFLPLVLRFSILDLSNLPVQLH